MAPPHRDDDDGGGGIAISVKTFNMPLDTLYSASIESCYTGGLLYFPLVKRGGSIPIARGGGIHTHVARGNSRGGKDEQPKQ